MNQNWRLLFMDENKQPDAPVTEEVNDEPTVPEVKDDLLISLKKLRFVIDLTRSNRINASNRLLKTEHFVQAINIYYSCVAAIVTVLSLIYKEGNYSIASAIMTIALAISIVYLNAQKYGNRAQQLQQNYLALHQLRFDIENAIRDRKEDCNKDIDIIGFQKRYVDLLQTSENHIDQDFRRTMWKNDHDRKNRSKDDYVPGLVGIERIKFYLRCIFKYTLQFCVWILPICYFVLTFMHII